MKTLVLLSIITSCLLSSCTYEQIVPEEVKLFPKVKGIVNNNCTNSCHSISHQYYQGAPIFFDTDEEISLHAAAIKASVADPVSYGNIRMPLNGSLSDSDIQTIVKWFEKGGKLTD